MRWADDKAYVVNRMAVLGEDLIRRIQRDAPSVAGSSGVTLAALKPSEIQGRL